VGGRAAAAAGLRKRQGHLQSPRKAVNSRPFPKNTMNRLLCVFTLLAALALAAPVLNAQKLKPAPSTIDTMMKKK
jgi:hypothetical protein